VKEKSLTSCQKLEGLWQAINSNTRYFCPSKD
jgi:hypothetical protein